MNATLAFTRTLSLFFLSVLLTLTHLTVSAQCTLSGSYANTNQFQNAMNAAKTAGCTTIILSGSAQFSNDITVPSDCNLVISGTVTINGTGTFTSTNPVTIEIGGTFNTKNNLVTIAGNTVSNYGTVVGYRVLNGIALRVLSVEWSDFAVKSVGKQHFLTWSTASEKDLSHFGVEHSTDGVIFYQIGQTKSKGAAQQKTNYDFAVVTPSVGINYYRIQSVDLDGKKSASPLVALENTSQQAALKIYPTVLNSDDLTIDLSGVSVRTNLQIINAIGQTIANLKTSPNQENQNLNFPVQSLKTGIYFVRWENGGTVLTQKFVRL